MSDLISRQAAIDAFDCTNELIVGGAANAQNVVNYINKVVGKIKDLPSVQPDFSEYSGKLWNRAYECGRSEAQAEIIRCMECKHWRQQTNYQGALLSFGFCESDDMWRSLYGETYEVSHIETDDDFYCGYAERREDE